MEKINVSIIVFQINKSYTIEEVAKLFKSRIRYLPERKGERYASALTSLSLSNKVHKNFGKIKLKEYIEDFLKKIRKISKKYLKDCLH